MNCDHGKEHESITVGRGCLDCAKRVLLAALPGRPASERTIGAELDLDWLGRELNRHAERATRAASEAAELRARLELMHQAHAETLARLERVNGAIHTIGARASQLQRDVDNAIPFGDHAVDEPTISIWKEKAAALLEAHAMLERARG